MKPFLRKAILPVKHSVNIQIVTVHSVLSNTREFDTLKSKNSESFYITQSYTNANGKSTSKTIRNEVERAAEYDFIHSEAPPIFTF